MKIIGYSERGAINSLLYGICYSSNANSLLGKLVSLITFLFQSDVSIDVQHAQALIEQSFSDFGDADAVFLIDSGKKKVSIFMEAKVKSSQKQDWLINDEFNKFKNDIEKFKNDNKKRVNSSNLFVQLYHKLRLVNELKQNGLNKLKEGVEFPKCSSKQFRKIGKNPVVLKAINLIKGYLDSTYYVSLVPDRREEVAKFYDNVLKNFAPSEFQQWDCSRYGFLCWKDIEGYCKENCLKKTLDILEFNEEQIFSRAQIESS